MSTNMPTHNLQLFIAKKKPGRLLGMDLGDKRIGLALSDATGLIATPHTILQRRPLKNVTEQVKTLINTQGIQGFVLGWPRHMSGREGKRCQSTQDFAQNLVEACPLPLLFWDERTSSQAANALLIREADLSRQKQAKVQDAVAAAWILQGALDALRRFE